MSDFNTRGKLPFTVVSSSVNTGYAAELTASVGYNIDLVNKHKDEYGQTKDAPAQGPFTNQHVGGNQHRHAPLNAGNDDATNRPEAYIISSSAGSIKVYGPDINGLDKPRSLLTRDNTAKSPINIKNIQTSGNIAGNFEHNYQVVQSVGRRTTNNLINDGFEASGSLTTKFVSGSHEIYTLPDIVNNSKSIFVERFNAPGGKEESSRGALDREGEEFSPNNSLTTRNIKVRQPYYNQLTQHAAQFNSGSTNKLLPDVGTTDAVTIHGVNRNTIEKVLTFLDKVDAYQLTGSLAVDTDDRFGLSVSINSSGNRVVVGAPQDEKTGTNNEGLAYVFTSGSTGWIEEILSGSLATTGDLFGQSVDINESGDRVVISAITDETSTGPLTSGIVYVFTSGSSGWSEQILSGSLAGTSDFFGNSVSINNSGNIVAVGAPQDERSGGQSSSGLAYIFTSGSSGWSETILSGSRAGNNSDNFGRRVVLNGIGDRVCISAPNDEAPFQGLEAGIVYVYTSGTLGWSEEILSGAIATSNTQFGSSVGMDKSGLKIIATDFLGTGYVFTSGSSGWQREIMAIGGPAAISGDGNKIIVGSDVYTIGSSGWKKTATLDTYGTFRMSLDGNSVVAGLSSGGSVNQGIAYIYNTQPSVEDLTTHDNFWVQHAIPSTDLRYKWIAESISSSQQPIQYQSYALPYSTDSSYNSNGAYTDIEFTQTGPFGDHLGISGAIDKDEMFTSNYTNTMYRDRKYFRFTPVNPIFPMISKIDLSDASETITEKDFTISFWIKIPRTADIPGPWTILDCIGSFGTNRLVLNLDVGKGMSRLQIIRSHPDTPFTFTNLLERNVVPANYNDDKWHLISLVNDQASFLRTISGSQNTIVPTNNIKIYVDGGLINESIQKYTKIDIQQIVLSAESSNGEFLYDGISIDEISIWDRALAEKEVLETFRISKSSYGETPRKYFEHKYKNIPQLQPKHTYSSRIDNQRKIIFDEIGNKHANLINYIPSEHIRPQNSGIVSYSTYFNGPYEGASWKSIRNAEHPVTRKLTTENTNIVSVTIPEGPRTVKRNSNGIPVTFQLPGSRKQGQLLNVKESPVYINNKPLKHRFILKDSRDQNIAIETTHTYGNNLQYFANQQLNDTLGLLKTERQMYNVLYDYYSGETEETENPIQKLVGYTYSETIFPKPGTGLLKETRQRTDYITDQPGYSVDGYDRQLGTQRVFWRDNQDDRMRTRRTYITSLGDQVESEYDLPFQTPSVAALEYISESNAIEHYSTNTISRFIFTSTRTGSFIDISYKNSAELNSSLNYINVNWGTTVLFNAYLNVLFPSFSVPEIYFFTDSSLTDRDQFNVALTSSMYPLQSTTDPSSLRLSPKMIFEHCSVVFSALTSPEIETNLYNFFTHDLGLNRFVEKISGKNPWYDSYEDYYVDIKTLSNDNLISYSRIPEFKISDQVSQLIAEYGGDSTKIILQEYLDDFQFSYKKPLDVDNRDIVEEDTINIVVDGIKKLLPYNGFYPQDRSLQLVNYLKQSYLDTNAIGGGLYLTSSTGGERIVRQQNDKLVQFMKESAFLEPLYSPGIFYNLIKSGIAVDWSVYTGSLPSDSFLIPLSEKPQFKITFESLLNLQNIPLSSSSDGAQNRIVKYKEVDNIWNSEEYSGTTSSSFQGFFEKLGDGSPLYTLSINNFLAETINFFLKDSTLNTFISKADSDFLSFDQNKTYYMDVVLRNSDIVMCEAHSSSLADSFGRMSGRYFGPSFWTGSVADQTRIENETILAETLRDPGYCAYTPPYYYGDSIARISFKPPLTRKYTLDEIFEEMEIQFMNTGFMNDSVYVSGSLYSSFVMPLESSVTIKGQIEDRQQTVQLENRSQNFSDAVTRNLANLVGTATNSTGIKKWVISPKMETPVLDFSNQEFVTSTTILTQSRADLELKTFIPTHTPPTASGFGRGMWSGYGEIPTGDKGIFLELRESYPRQLIRVLDPTTRQFVETNTGSLLQACGFQASNDKLSKKIGEIADSREISEAIVIIPYLDSASTGKTIGFGGFSTLRVNDTVEIEGKNFIKINQNIFNYQKTNVLANKPAVSLADFSTTGAGSIQETSISRMIGLMNKYVLPPNFDFLLNDSVTPFVMYIAEFTSNLDKQDLADIWQGVMPKIAMRAEREKTVISHKNTQFDFFHGQGLPEDVKFMIFKAKKRAEINYYKMTADSSDDGLFPSIQAGKPPSPYSFNWPYDYCSLVETARVDVEIEYINKSGSNNT